MESNGFPMCIHVSSATKILLEDECDWIEYGSRQIKGKGSMTTYIAKVGEWDAAIRARDEVPVLGIDGSVGGSPEPQGAHMVANPGFHATSTPRWGCLSVSFFQISLHPLLLFFAFIAHADYLVLSFCFSVSSARTRKHVHARTCALDA